MTKEFAKSELNTNTEIVRIRQKKIIILLYQLHLQCDICDFYQIEINF